MKNNNKHFLINKLKEWNVFWSYNQENIDQVPDEIIIEKTFLYGDLEEIAILFKIYNRSFIHRVWKENLLTQEPYYRNLNKFIAWFYFNEEIK